MLFTAQSNTLTPASRAAEQWLAGKQGAVELKPVTQAQKRSAEANAKYWAWCAQIESETGNEPGWAHRYHKLEIGLAILTRKHPEYRDKLIGLIRPLGYDDRLAAMDFISCTSQFSRSEMSEFMDAVQRHWAENGIELT